MSDENIDLLTENFSTASEEEKLALSSAFDGKATPEEIELLKNSEQNQSETVQKLLQQIIDNQKGIVLYQSAMMHGINPNQKVDVVDLSSQSQNIIDKKSLLSYINSLVGQNGITTKDKKAILNFIQKSYRIDKNGKGFNINVPRHIVYSSLNDNRAERSIVVNNIVDLIKQSVMIEVEKNTKKSRKPYVDEYYRFYVPVRINSDIYTIRLVAENQNKNNLFNIVKPSVYDVIIDKKRTSPKVTNAPVLRSPNNSINHFQQNTSAEQITIREMLTNVEDADGNVYYQPAVTDGAENSADKQGTINESNPNIYFQSVKQGIWDKNVTPVNIQVDSVPNFDNVKDLKNWIQENLNLLGDVTIKDNNRIVHFSKSNIGRSMKGVNRDSAKRESYSGLKELVENAVYGYNNLLISDILKEITDKKFITMLLFIITKFMVLK